MTDLTFLHGAATPRCMARVDKYFAGYFTLQFMAEGGVELFYDETQHILMGRWFWTAYPGPRIRFHAAPEQGFWNHRYAAFRGPRVARWQAAGLWPIEPQIAPPNADWEARFNELIRLSASVERFQVLRAAHLLEGILLDLAQARLEMGRSDTKTPEPWLETVLHELEKSAEFMPDYQALAASCGMGHSTLRRRFKAATGTALHNYVMQNRIAQARRLLTETEMPIKAIAAQLGYSDVYFFAAQFRRVTGITPAAYRRSRLI